MKSLFAHMMLGMELIPFMLLALSLAGLCSIIGFFAAFFNRATARVCARLAFGAIAADFLLVLAANQWNFDWLLHLLLQPSPINVVIYGSLMLSLVAAFVPLRKTVPAAPNSVRVAERPRWSVFILACLAATSLVVYGVMQVVDARRGEQKTRALLSGEPDARFERFQIDHQQRRVICTDPVVLRYLEDRFRQHDPRRLELGWTYQLTLYYEGGGTHSFATYWSDSGDFSLSLPEHGDGGPSHGILLTRPLPAPVSELVNFLNSDYREVAGTILILEPGGIRRERDESLVARAR